MEKSYRTLLTAIIGLVIILNGCKPEPNPVPTPPPTTASIFNENQVTKQTFTLSGAFGGTFTGSQGTILDFRDSIFIDPMGNVMSGDLTVELTEIYKKSDMVWNRRPSFGHDTLLIANGLINVKVSFNNTYVKLRTDSGFHIRYYKR